MLIFFIDRPVFAWVMAIVVMLCGVFSLFFLPIAQYPEIAPPRIVIGIDYPGASAQSIENTVVQVIEPAMTGFDDLVSVYSQSCSAGWAEITLTFKAGTDAELAQVQVQNKLQGVMPLLPQAVQSHGVKVSKSGGTSLLGIALISPDGSHSSYDLTDFFASTLRDPIRRISGVGSLVIYGAQYAMRVWLDPHKLHSYRLMPADVVKAIREQNYQVPMGSLGGTPLVEGQQTTVSLTARGLLSTPEEFGRILLKTNGDGSKVRVRDVGRVEIGAEYYSTSATLNGQPACGSSLKLAPIEVSIQGIFRTLLEAMALVVLVMYFFLQSFRATLIPTIAIPVVLLGTFGVMSVLGVSINILTMFGLVLAIGLVVDDAIVVVENVERIMAEQGVPPGEATRQSMGQISGALVGVGMVLSAVFVPMAFLSGATGIIYRQFSITLVTAMSLSVIVALVLTPSLCASILRPGPGRKKNRGFWGWLNGRYEKLAGLYGRGVAYVLHRVVRFCLVYLVLMGVAAGIFTRLPTSFIPQEDQGVFLTSVQLPVGATMERTQAVLDRVSSFLLEQEKENVASVLTVAGFSFAGDGQNMGFISTRLKDWSLRKRKDQSVYAVLERTRKFFSEIREARLFAFNLSGLPVGGSAGFDLFLQDVNGRGHDGLVAARDQLLALAAKDLNLAWMRANGMEDTPEYAVQVDYEKAMAMGLSPGDINATLGIAWGTSYVNNFIHRGKLKKVYLQADAPYRMQAKDIKSWHVLQADAPYRMQAKDIKIWHVRNKYGNMVPLSAFSSADWSYGSPRLERFNGIAALQIQGEPAPGKSSGQAMQTIADIVASLPGGFGYEWTGASYQEVTSGGQAPFLYAISLLVVFLCLAALYESWTVPFSVMLAVPLGVLGALLATWMRGMENDIYFQVGLLTTIGLADNHWAVRKKRCADCGICQTAGGRG